MKRFAAVVLVFFLGVLPGALGQGLDDEYVQIFKLIQEGDSLSSTAPGQALSKYREAQAALDVLHKGSPTWNERIVNYRLTYLADRIAALSATSSPPVAPQTNQTKPAGPAPGPAQPAAPADWQAQLAGLQDRTAQLQSDNALLQAKLKEALAMRPASVDPGALARAEEKVKALQKENDLLRVSVEREKQTPVPATDPKALAMKPASVDPAVLARSEEKIKALQKENDLLKASVEREKHTPVPATDPKALESAQRQVADANRQVTDQAARISKLSLEKEALENRVKQLNASLPASSNSSVAITPAESSRIKQLEHERDELQKQLEAASRDKSSRKAKGSPRAQDLENQLATARTRIEILETRATPYTSEELDLLKRPPTKLAEADPKSGKKSIKELPAGSASLVAEAQRYFAAKQMDKAEAAYLQVLQQDPKNVPTLANLAAIQVEEQHYDQAEANIKQALAQEPDDPYSLYILGILRFRQGKYDEALDALGRSAKLDPQNAEVQNYLGLALSEKGLRGPAEAALRKAIQLQPGYAGAHYNLAVVYATQQPPATELAKWHYQKAIAAGHPRNPDLEKKFEVRP